MVIYYIKLQVSLLSNKYQHIHEEWKYLEDLMQWKEAGAMTLKSDEIICWNTLVSSLLSLTASAMAFSSAITDKAVNW